MLYLLHGIGGDEKEWLTHGQPQVILDNMYADGKIEPMIVVMPNGNVIQDGAPGEGSKNMYKPQFMIPKTMDGTYEGAFSDIIKFVESNYRVKADKANRAIAGLSMGGYHTLHISRYHPNTFDYMGLFSAAIMPREDATGKVYSNFDETLKAQMDKSIDFGSNVLIDWVVFWIVGFQIKTYPKLCEIGKLQGLMKPLDGQGNIHVAIYRIGLTNLLEVGNGKI